MQRDNVHLTDGARDLCPYAVDVVVQSLEREDLQRSIGLAEEANKPSGRGQGDHDGSVCVICGSVARRIVRWRRLLLMR